MGSTNDEPKSLTGLRLRARARHAAKTQWHRGLRVVEQRLDAVNPALKHVVRDQRPARLVEGELRVSEATLNDLMQRFAGAGKKLTAGKVRLSRDAIELFAEFSAYGEPGKVRLKIALLRGEAARDRVLLEFRLLGPITLDLAGTHSTLDGKLPGVALKRFLKNRKNPAEPIVEELADGVFRLSLHRLEGVRRGLEANFRGLGPLDVLWIQQVATDDAAMTIRLRATPGAARKLIDLLAGVVREQIDRALERGLLETLREAIGSIQGGRF